MDSNAATTQRPPAGGDIPPGEPGRTQRIVALEAIPATAHGAITTGALVTAYALMLGATDFHLGLVTAMSAIGSAGALVGAQLVPRLGSRKRLVLPTAILSRFAWVLLCAIPFVPAPPAWRLAAFLVVVFVCAFSLNVAANAWISWVTDLVPLQRRGRYFAIRNTLAGGVGMLATYAIGWSYDLLKIRVEPAVAFIPFFAAAGVIGLASSYCYGRQWEPPLAEAEKTTLREMLVLPWRNRDFRRLTIFFMLWGIACAIGGPFFMPHMLKNLHMSLSQAALYSILAGVSNLAVQPLWGRIVDRFGNRPVLLFNIVGVFTLPPLWFFATPDALWPVWLDAVLTGIFWPGLNLAAFNLLILTAPQANRTAYLAVYTLATGIFQFLAASLGGFIAQYLTAFQWTFCGQTLVNFHILFLISAVGRLACLPLARRLREDTAQPVGAMLSMAGDKALRSVNWSVQFTGQLLRRLGWF